MWEIANWVSRLMTIKSWTAWKTQRNLLFTQYQGGCNGTGHYIKLRKNTLKWEQTTCHIHCHHRCLTQPRRVNNFHTANVLEPTVGYKNRLRKYLSCSLLQARTVYLGNNLSSTPDYHLLRWCCRVSTVAAWVLVNKAWSQIDWYSYKEKTFCLNAL